MGEVSALAHGIALEYGMPEARALRLARLYGAESADILSRDAKLIGDSDIFAGEVAFAIHNEGAYSLADVLYRRMRALYYLPEQVAAIVEPVSVLMADELGWTQTQRRSEIDTFRARLAEDLGALA